MDQFDFLEENEHFYQIAKDKFYFYYRFKGFDKEEKCNFHAFIRIPRTAECKISSSFEKYQFNKVSINIKTIEEAPLWFSSLFTKAEDLVNKRDRIRKFFLKGKIT